MSEQNFKNHSRLIFLWHGATLLAIVAVLIGSIVNLIHSDAHTHYSAALLVVVALILAILWTYTRIFALKAQDRAIRAEENFRHFILTGKPLDKQLQLGQIIALRFASDDELPALAKKAVEEKLSSKQIKEAVQNWRGDYHRV
jgi:glucan phosphoethanolaminetransferase (alkaline phosphatase superfamily)